MAEQAGGMDGTLQKARYTSRWRRERYLTVAEGSSSGGNCKFARAARRRSLMAPKSNTFEKETARPVTLHPLIPYFLTLGGPFGPG